MEKERLEQLRREEEGEESSGYEGQDWMHMSNDRNSQQWKWMKYEKDNQHLRIYITIQTINNKQLIFTFSHIVFSLD